MKLTYLALSIFATSIAGRALQEPSNDQVAGTVVARADAPAKPPATSSKPPMTDAEKKKANAEKVARVRQEWEEAGRRRAARLADSADSNPSDGTCFTTKPANQKYIDFMCFEKDLKAFTEERQKQMSNPSYNCWDWTSDGCTSAPDKPFGHDFKAACERHDFCYRNTKRHDRFDKERNAIDLNFLNE